MRHSRETELMLKKRRGYRCESAYGSGIRTPSKVFDFEFNELHNEPMLEEFCQALSIPNDRCKLHTLMDVLESQIDRKYDALWLATKTNVRHYCQSGESPDEYQIPIGSIVASDLGEDGTLFLIPKVMR